ncbi:ribosomal-protein-alanine N-acetyltransferase [Solirubrobacter pauli]|uniref:Ribosomal-protein-alanine N-acetyltransferase n=1 Tax=Solirubrobacter pauli TaxID=166793 RepID=A0A660LEK2_9ACTN|nr:GNAT family protein [Solirubrobacter pauli]RKQ91171.1 ribosomal-protein-alanine N-acetyltransferase [Solirubrobacter pauli]
MSGPRLTLRYPAAEDAPRLFDLASNPLVTRWFSWGPYAEVGQAEAWIAAQASKRESGEIMDFVVDSPDGVLGVTGLTEVSKRDRRATVGSWMGEPHWGSGANSEAKALISGLAFRRLGAERLTAWANTRNGRSQRALERVGFRREGVLRAWHRHGDEMHDVVVFALVRDVWERSPLAQVPVRIEGTPPPSFVLG